MKAEKYYETWKHVTTLTSALMVIVVGLSSKLSLPQGFATNTLVSIFGLSVLVALAYSVLAMYQFSSSIRRSINSGKIGLFAFVVALYLVFGGTMFALVKNVSIFEDNNRGNVLNDLLSNMEGRQTLFEQLVELPVCSPQTLALQDIQEYESDLRKTRRSLREYEGLMSQKQVEVGCTIHRFLKSEPVDLDNSFIGGNEKPH